MSEEERIGRFIETKRGPVAIGRVGFEKMIEVGLRKFHEGDRERAREVLSGAIYLLRSLLIEGGAVTSSGRVLEIETNLMRLSSQRGTMEWVKTDKLRTEDGKTVGSDERVILLHLDAVKALGHWRTKDGSEVVTVDGHDREGSSLMRTLTGAMHKEVVKAGVSLPPGMTLGPLAKQVVLDMIIEAGA